MNLDYLRTVPTTVPMRRVKLTRAKRKALREAKEEVAFALRIEKTQLAMSAYEQRLTNYLKS